MPISKRCAGIAALMAAVAFLVPSCSKQAPAASQPGPLNALIGDNGLYVSGESYSTSQSSVSFIDTVYDDLVIKEAGSTAPAMLHNNAASTALKDFTEQNPIWGRWFSAVARRTAGEPQSPQDEAGLDGFFHKEGYWAEPGQKTGDTTAQLETTWAALQILAQSGKAPEPTAADSAKTWLEQQTAHIQFPVQACEIAQSFQVLGSPAPAAVGHYADQWLATHDTARFKDTPALADTYGAACAASLTHTMSADRQSALTGMLTPYLADDATTSLQRYYLTEIWLAAGGHRSDLATLGANALSDLHGTGVSRGHTTMTGGLVPTFFAIEAQKETGYLDLARIPYIKRTLASTDPAGDPMEYLAGAAALCALNACTSSQTAIQHAIDRLPTTINAQTMDGYAGVNQFLHAIGRSYPAVAVQKIDTSTPQGLHALVMATAALPADQALAQTLSTQTIRQGLSKETSPWNDPATINAAVNVLTDRHALDTTTSHAVRSLLSRLHGCAGIHDLYAAQPVAGAPCDLATTWETLQTLHALQA